MSIPTEALPLYLQRPQKVEYYYGTLDYDTQTDSWVIEGEPVVCQVAKRLFPGADGRRKGICKFKANKRTNGDLNWLMLRYPLQIKNRFKWERDYQEAVKHVTKRNEIRRGPQKLEPSGMMFRGQLAEFQKEGVAFLHYNAPTLLADDMGLGKTVQGLAWAAMVDWYPGIVIAPPSVQLQWKSQIERFIVPKEVNGQQEFQLDGVSPSRQVHIIRGLTPYDLPEANFYIIHYGLLRGWKQYLESFGFKFAIFDEIQELRHAGTDKYSAASLLAQSIGDNVIGLSGTPIYGKGAEIHNVMNIMDFQCLGDKESFSREWCEGYGGDIVTDPELLGEHLRREGLMLRRTKQEVQKELPPKRHIVQEIDSDEAALNRSMKEVIALIGRHDESQDHFERGRIKREIGERLRQATGVAKAPYVAEFVKMLLEAGERVVLYGYHHEVYRIWRERLKTFNPQFVTGEETMNQKEQAKAAFIAGDSDLIIISVRAAAGIDGLQHRAYINVFGELDWSPGIHSQCEDRLDRMGQTQSVMNYYLVCGQGSDEQMMEALGFKTSQFVGIMGGEAETEEEREISQIEVGKHLDKVIERIRRSAY